MKIRKTLCVVLALAMMATVCLAEETGSGAADRTNAATAGEAGAAEAEAMDNGSPDSQGLETADGTGLVHVEEMGLELSESRVTYPAVTGLGEELNRAVNEKILSDCGIPDYLARMSQLLSGGSLQVTWMGGVVGDVFSCAVRADGDIQDSRPESRWTWSSIDLRNGEEIRAEALFQKNEVPREALEALLEEKIAPELSAHLMNSALSPLPEGFWFNETGIIFLYPFDQLSTLSDQAGAVHLSWSEIQPWLNLEEGGLADRLGARKMLRLEGDAGIREMTESGGLPGIPARLGENLEPLTDRWKLLTDPDVYSDGESGRMFALEGAVFRDVFLLTDFLSEDWSESRVQGIRADRGNFRGLCIGETQRPEWQRELGEPETTIPVDVEKAELLRMTEIMEAFPGNCDYYPFGAYRLRLYSDAEGKLVSIVLTE